MLLCKCALNQWFSNTRSWTQNKVMELLTSTIDYDINIDTWFNYIFMQDNQTHRSSGLRFCAGWSIGHIWNYTVQFWVCWVDDDDGNLPYQSILVNIGPLHLFSPFTCQHHWPSKNVQILLVTKKHKEFNIYTTRTLFLLSFTTNTPRITNRNNLFSTGYNTLSSESATLKAGVHTSLCHKANDCDSPLHYIKHAVKASARGASKASCTESLPAITNHHKAAI